MSEPFVAEIRMFGGNFAPSGWATCDGQLLPISQNTALFSLLGTFYGGNGTTTFALPNLSGASPIHQGRGPGLSERFLGETGGVDVVTLLATEMPFHTHLMEASTDDANIASPGSSVGAVADPPLYHATSDTTMGFQALSVAGSSLPHQNRQPYLAVTFIIALQGVFPPRG